MPADDLARAWADRLGAPLPAEALTLLSALPGNAAAVLHDAFAAVPALTRDRLTGLLARPVFEEAVKHEVASTARHGAPTLLVADLDGLTGWMEARGHLAGDLLVMRLAEILRSSSRRSDVQGRLGVDQLAVLLPRTDVPRALVVARRVLARAQSDLRIAEREQPGSQATYPRLSISVAHLAEPSSSDALVQVAEAALERARRAGGRVIEIGTLADLGILEEREAAAV